MVSTTTIAGTWSTSTSAAGPSQARTPPPRRSDHPPRRRRRPPRPTCLRDHYRRCAGTDRRRDPRHRHARHVSQRALHRAQPRPRGQPRLRDLRDRHGAHATTCQNTTNTDRGPRPSDTTRTTRLGRPQRPPAHDEPRRTTRSDQRPNARSHANAATRARRDQIRDAWTRTATSSQLSAGQSSSPRPSPPHNQRAPLHARHARVGPASNSDARPPFRPAGPRTFTIECSARQLITAIIDPEHVHLGKTNQQLTNTCRVALHRDSPDRDGVRTSRFSVSRRRGGPFYTHTPRSDPKRRQSGATSVRSTGRSLPSRTQAVARAAIPRARRRRVARSLAHRSEHEGIITG